MPDKEAAKEELKRLIARYETTLSEGRAKQYNEERTKKDFILPLFKILGWATETEEVTAEDKVSKGRVDYGFRINELLKLVVEAKPLRADLDKPEYAEQAVDYAWHKGISWAVLTNFEKIILFNADLRLQNPLQNAKLRLSFSQFLDRFEDLWLLSKESIEGNTLEAWGQRYAVGPKKVDVGEQILADLMEWREWLTKDINKRPDNKKVVSSEEELDEAVQRILDRLIFIRTCEDREFEEKLLHQLLEDWRSSSRKSLFSGLVRIFEYFNENYDSKLFLSHSCDKLAINNEVLALVLEGLYRTRDKAVRYDFSLIEADVLGSIYENYLGHVLRQTAKRVKVADTPNHRKQLGIYYTPPYIVDYIVKNALGELLKGKKADEIKDIKVLDPACGSGSFLIKAFDTISQAYKQKNGEELPFNKKKDILTNNIFGVDLDPKAVEIAQLNLMLKAVEKKKLLPMLQDNVKIGNSLIDDPAVAGNRAFKWEEQFKEILKSGGFDVVVGNPPYIRIHEFDNEDKKHFAENYSSATGQYDIYVLFIEKALSILKEKGLLGFIVSNKFLVSDYGLGLREVILSKAKIKMVVDVSNIKIFRDASVYPVVIILEKTSDQKQIEGNKIRIIQNVITSNELTEKPGKFVKQSEFKKNKGYIIDISSTDYGLIKKLEEGKTYLNEVVKITRGFRPPKKELVSNYLSKNMHKYLLGKDLISRYNIKWSGNCVKYNEKKIAESKPLKTFLQQKILIRDIGKSFNACFDDGEFLCLKTIYFLYDFKNINSKYLLGVINSKVMLFYFKSKFSVMHIQGGYLRFRKQFLDQLPIKIVSESHQQPLIKLVDKMLSLNKRLNEIGDKNTDEKLRVQEEIKRTDAEIDELVYRLYGITVEERRIIEEALK